MGYTVAKRRGGRPKKWFGTWKAGGDHEPGEEVIEADTRTECRRYSVAIYGHGNVVVRKRVSPGSPQ